MGLFDRLTKTPAERDAKKLRKLEAKIMNSAWAQDVDRQFYAGMGGAGFERKEGDGMVIYQKKSSGAGKEPSHQEPKENGGSSGGKGPAKTS